MKQYKKTAAITLIYLFGHALSFAQSTALINYVNPFIGTAKMGHTYPGATVPFGAVQLSPDTDTISMHTDGKYNKDVYKYCAGYQYSDSTIVGFSHTHFSGTGHSDLGDLLIAPTTGELQLNPGTADHPENGFRSRFEHKNETASPNYYKVQLDDHNITAELTTTSRVGVHRYTFPASKQAHIILDLMSGIYNHDSKNVWTFLRVENDSLITGYKQTTGWARTRTVYFAIAFSKAFKSYGWKSYDKTAYSGFWNKYDQYHNFPEMAGEQLRAYVNFETKENEQITLKVGLSSISTENALNNLLAEAPLWNFDDIRKNGEKMWENELSKIKVETITEDDKVNFYTAMYHAFLSPTIYMDVNRKYKGLDQVAHDAKGFSNYTTFSLWDTYRALHPLLNLIQTQRNNDMISSMLLHYDQSAEKMLPVWSHYNNENWCMIGYHSVAVIANAVATGNYTNNLQFALQACVKTSKSKYDDGIQQYMKLGYVPAEKGSSVSKTLEYAYDDWAIAQIAKKMNNTSLYNEYMKRSENYKNVFDPSVRFMRPKDSMGKFVQEFDPLNTHDRGFIEGNAWNYSLYVPHQPDSLIRLNGGQKKFTQHLDSLFTMELADKYFEHTEDISRDGIIGNYVHGNEPSHHVAYLYNWTNQPWKTQATVRMILGEMYHPKPNGLGGNDDCGQMSAWYIFSALGLYPVAPGSDFYSTGSPLVKHAEIKFESGKLLTINAINQSEKNVYVQKITLNGIPIKNFQLKHADLVEGGLLEFTMGSKPKK